MTSLLINSEIGPLESVIVHRPGPEVEMMSPAAASAALYDDIIARKRAAMEHDQLAGTLAVVAEVHNLDTLLARLLAVPAARARLTTDLCRAYDCPEVQAFLDDLPAERLAVQLILGIPRPESTLGRLLGRTAFAIPPMYNLYFTRDATMVVNDRLIVGAMRNRARIGEAIVMKAILSELPQFQYAGCYLDGTEPRPPSLTVEGGDVLVLREDLILIGQGERTSVEGVEALLSSFAEAGMVRHVIVQPMVESRAYIHLDLLFTMLDHDLCIVHEPVILGPGRWAPVHIELNGEATPHYRQHDNLISLLAELGMPLETITTGGTEPLHQAREQWHKGTNFFSFGPGRVIGYDRNEQTLRQMESHGFRIVAPGEVMDGSVDLSAPGRIAVAMEGAELARGGGGCRCMTLPLRRTPLAP